MPEEHFCAQNSSLKLSINYQPVYCLLENCKLWAQATVHDIWSSNLKIMHVIDSPAD